MKLLIYYIFLIAIKQYLSREINENSAISWESSNMYCIVISIYVFTTHQSPVHFLQLQQYLVLTFNFQSVANTNQQTLFNAFLSRDIKNGSTYYFVGRMVFNRILYSSCSLNQFQQYSSTVTLVQYSMNYSCVNNFRTFPSSILQS